MRVEGSRAGPVHQSQKCKDQCIYYYAKFDLYIRLPAYIKNFTVKPQNGQNQL